MRVNINGCPVHLPSLSDDDLVDLLARQSARRQHIDDESVLLRQEQRRRKGSTST